MIETAAKRPNIYNTAGAYIAGHWRGDHSLIVSFWVNLALLRAAIFFLSEFTHPPSIGDPYTAAFVSVLFIAIAHIAIYGWQIVGVVRACDRYQATEGAIVPVYGVYFGIAVSLFFTFSSAFTAVQTIFAESDKTLLSLIWERERASRYSIRLSDEGTTIHLDGSFERGMTEKLRTVLAQNRNVKRIVLASTGGNIFEGRGVGKTILDRGLDAHVNGSCLSTCARAFIAGKTRTIGPDAKLGFHRYRLDAVYPMPFVDVDEEQDTDRAFYRSRGVDDAFLAHMFDRVPPDIWLPPVETLVEVGFAHRIAR